MDIGSSRLGSAAVDPSAGRGEAPLRSTPWQHITGTGQVEKVLRTERFRLRKEHKREESVFQKQQRQRTKKFAESMEQRRERFFRQYGLPQLINRSPTREERQDLKLARRVERYETMEESSQRAFKRSERDLERQMERAYAKRKRELPGQLRKQGPRAFLQRRGPRPFLDHLLGVGRKTGLSA